MSTFEGIHALIIEDDQTSVAVLQGLLTTLGVWAEVILDSPNVQDRLLQLTDRPDVIFLDLEMPITNGYDTLSILNGDPRFDNVPVVAYTTHISHMNEALEAGFHSFLGKPLDKKLFPEQLARILAGGTVWAAR
jgi:CheY-like chemotaxis protein